LVSKKIFACFCIGFFFLLIFSGVFAISPVKANFATADTRFVILNLDYGPQIAVDTDNAIKISLRNAGTFMAVAYPTVSCTSNNNPGNDWIPPGFPGLYLEGNQLGSTTITIPQNALLPNDVYSCEIKIFNSETGLADDSRSIFISTLGLEQSSTPVPETSALFLPLIIVIVLGLLALSKKRKNQ
jgi:hypothetical protein